MESYAALKSGFRVLSCVLRFWFSGVRVGVRIGILRRLVFRTTGTPDILIADEFVCARPTSDSLTLISPGWLLFLKLLWELLNVGFLYAGRKGGVAPTTSDSTSIPKRMFGSADLL